MLGERVLRRIEHFLDEAEDAVAQKNWALVRENAQAVLALDPENADACTFLAAADRALAAEVPSSEFKVPRVERPLGTRNPELGTGHPASFCGGRYQVRKFLGEGGKKRVYLAHDTKLDREVAFALIKTEGLDQEGLVRIRREAQAMARLGDHPHIVTVYDIGEEDGQPYLVSQYMAGGDLGDRLGQAADHCLPLEEVLPIADQVCQALEHAHKQGIVHRDVKPGNVWLAGEGGLGGWVPGTGDNEPSSLEPGTRHPTPDATPVVVKLGDFGLALSLDRSRLTQAGMMVGTVAYMPPEQAVGGNVDARGDLYSLGAMLYEMVTGRPPFLGDDTVAIIGQHLNTPPVAPLWHRPDVPPALEALILRLLEKDPAKRPASAAEVRQLLISVEQGQRPTAEEPSGVAPTAGGPANPMYRRTFVGREAELRQLKAAFDGAISGQGALLMVVGEPGIGKTALCEQVTTYAALRGGRTLVGHCYEEGSLTLPYLAFVEAMRSYVLGREPDGLKEDLGTGAADVARIVSEVRDRVAVEPRPPGDPEDDRWRLLQAVASFLRNAASVQPILLVLEDLHWADRGTLDLLIHLARNLSGARLLVVGTYRDVEVDRAHPLSAALAELRRVGDLPRVLLRGLTPDEVHRMINSISRQEVRWSLAEAVHRQTEGNPLFVQEVLRFMVEEGLIVRQEGRWEGRWRRSGEALPELSIPEGLRDVIGRRLSRLSGECNRLLAIAAVIGREFDLQTLEAVAQMDEEAVLAALEQAIRVGVLEEQTRTGGVRYRFAHAFFRQTLYEEMIAPRRLRLHQQVARALEAIYAPRDRIGGEQRGPLAPSTAPIGPRERASESAQRTRPAGRLEEHAAELAEHFGQSTDAGDLAKAVHYAELAARRASAAYAYPDAVRLLERALLPAGEPRRAADEVAEEAFRLAEAMADRRRASRACQLALTGLRNFGGSIVYGTPAYREWAQRSDRYAEPETVERVHADIALGLGSQGREALLTRALELARRLKDPAALFEVARPLLLPVAAPHQMEEQFRLAEESLSWPREGVGVRTLGTVLFWSGLVLWAWGHRERAEALWREVVELAGRTRDPTLQLYAMEPEVHAALFDGQLEGAVELGERHVARADELGSPVLGRQRSAGTTRRALLWLGRAEEALKAAAELSEMAGADRGAAAFQADRGAAAFQALVLAHAGRREEAQPILDQQMRDLHRTALEDELPATGTLCQLLETAVLLEDREAGAALAEALEGLGQLLTLRSPTSVARHLGGAAALLGKPGEARAYYRQALEVCERVRFRPEIALIHLQLAELLIEEFRVSGSEFRVGGSELETRNAEPETLREAREHLDFAIAELRAMKMQPSLERALALKQALGV